MKNLIPLKILRLISVGALLLLMFGTNKVLAQGQAPNKPALFETMKSTEPESRIRSGIAMWSDFVNEREQVRDLMRNDKNREVRRRLAQVLAERDKDPDAVAILENVLKESDIHKHKGAEEALTAAGVLTNATGKVHGVDNALNIMTAPPDWFSDVNASSNAFALKDSLRVMAASFLSQQGATVPKEKYKKGLEVYCQDIENHIQKSSGKERKYWEARLPTILNIAIRAGMPEIVLKFESKTELFQEKYERERFMRVVEKAKGSRK